MPLSAAIVGEYPHPALDRPSCMYGNGISQTAGASGKRLPSCYLRANLQV